MDLNGLFSLDGRTALVTGGATGIGRHIAAGLAAAGAKVYICGRREPLVNDVAAQIAAETGAEVIGIGADIGSLAGITALVETLSAKETALHILVNNAGAMYDAPIDSFTEEGWDSVMDLNLKSPFFLMQRLLPLLRAAGTRELPSSVINIGSVGALKVGPKENYSYQASKAATHFLVKSYARQLAKAHITVNSIAPGFFQSEITAMSDAEIQAVADAMVPRGRAGTAEDLAGVAIFLTSRAGAYVTGAVIPVEGGLSI